MCLAGAGTFGWTAAVAWRRGETAGLSKRVQARWNAGSICVVKRGSKEKDQESVSLRSLRDSLHWFLDFVDEGIKKIYILYHEI